MNTNNTKIAFFDIDGTIYLYGKGVPDDTKSSIKKFRENGNIAVICTGRTKNMIFPEILDIGFDGIIAGAGTYVDCQGAFYKYILPEEISWSVVSDMKKNNDIIKL